MNTQRFNLQIVTCHRCSFSQTRHTGGCAGPCPCHIDRRDIIEHARLNYCPAGFYPLAGLGSAIAWLLWETRVARVWFWLRKWAKPCKCGERAAALNRFGAWIVNKARSFWRRVRSAKARP